MALLHEHGARQIELSAYHGRCMFSKRTGWKLTPNRFTQAQIELRSAGREVLDLAISNPTRAGLLYDSESILRALSAKEALDYDPQPRGLPAARAAVAAYYRERGREFEVDPESIILTTSTSEGYAFVFQLLCDPGDEVLVPKPSYPLFEFLADLHDVTLKPYPLLYDHGWQMDFHALAAAIGPRTRAITVVHPNNPTGSYVSPGERTQLNSFCREHGLALIVDEVFLDYPHDQAPRASFVTKCDVLTFTLSGLSKIAGLPQMKLAWIAASGPQPSLVPALDRMEIIADTYLSMNAPIQLAAASLLEQRKKIQPLILDRVRTNLLELDRQLAIQKSARRLQVEAGWYAVLRVPAIRSDEDLAIDLLRHESVLVHPGHFYDFPSDGYLVVSLLTQPVHFRDGVSRIFDFLNKS